MTSQAVRYFAGWARRYDSDMQRFGYSEPQRIFETVAPLLNLAAPLRILDVGIGTGLSAMPFRAAMPQARITGVDASPAMLALCRAKAVADELVQADACALPFEDASFDLVLAAGVLEYSDDPEAFFEEIARVLAPQGIAAVTYEPQDTEIIYKKGLLGGVIRQTGLQSTVRCLMPKRFIPSFYHKYLYAPEAVGNFFDRSRIGEVTQSIHEVYQWSSHTPPIPHIIAIARKGG